MHQNMSQSISLSGYAFDFFKFDSLSISLNMMNFTSYPKNYPTKIQLPLWNELSTPVMFTLDKFRVALPNCQ